MATGGSIPANTSRANSLFDPVLQIEQVSQPGEEPITKVQVEKPISGNGGKVSGISREQLDRMQERKGCMQQCMGQCGGAPQDGGAGIGTGQGGLFY